MYSSTLPLTVGKQSDISSKVDIRERVQALYNDLCVLSRRGLYDWIALGVTECRQHVVVALGPPSFLSLSKTYVGCSSTSVGIDKRVYYDAGVFRCHGNIHVPN